MSKKIKDMLVADLRQRLGDCRDMLVVDYSRLDGVTENTLRIKLRKQNIRMLGVKNSLARKVLGDLGLGELDTFLSGPSTLVYGGADIVALSKEISKWAKDLEPLSIKGGIVDGSAVDAAQVDVLSKSPSREELLGKIVMLALSPGRQLAAALLGAGGTVSGQVKSLADKEPVGEPEAVAAS
jgi:large subunit ribosomal protein L10